MRLASRSRLRRLFLSRTGSRAAAAANRRDFDVLLYAFDEGIEYRPGDRLGPLAFGLDAVFVGHQGYREVWQRMIEAFADFRLEPEEGLDFGDQVLATVRLRGHGTGSGVPVDLQVFQLFGLRRGLIVWQRDYIDRSEALEAAGLAV
jgi:ketosteroid isomerase-like protein